MTGKELLEIISASKAEGLFSSLYGAESVDAARLRYGSLIEGLMQDFSSEKFPETSGDLRVFSVPGRTELGGNHTDHNRGKVLAASIQLDAVAVVAPRWDMQVFFRSKGHPDVKVDISDLSVMEDEKGKTESLVRGIAAELAARRIPLRGFTANADNMVLSGSGLSSSAAIEVLIGKIFDNLYGDGKKSALELAKIGQKAENEYFGKPCGLMDQVACASGGAVAIDFGDPGNPEVKSIGFDPASLGFALCIVNTKGSHSDLTPDYAAVPAEMKAAASFFGKHVLRELDEKTLLARLADLRNAVGDRAILRAMHFFSENRRVDAMLAALEEMAALQAESASADKKSAGMDEFLALVRESGDSSWELLQNVYSPKSLNEQGLSLALALTKNFLAPGNGACRVHGGGFAGTIQAYIPMEMIKDYRSLMEGIFGIGALTVLRIRPLGAVELDFKQA
jgi:galactokinase